MKFSRAAFTLIELLVVIVIVAILAAIVAPVLSKMQIASRNLQCESNLRQIGAGMLTFAGEHNGIMPLAGANIPYRSTDPTSGQPGWTEQIAPYVGTDRKIFICPSSSTLLTDNVQYSYFMGCRAAYVANGQQFGAIRLARLQAPSKYIIAGDISANGLFTATDADKDDYMNNAPFTPQTRIFHGKNSNLVFADGHVGAYPKFDPKFMTTHYDLKDDGTGYSYGE